MFRLDQPSDGAPLRRGSAFQQLVLRRAGVAKDAQAVAQRRAYAARHEAWFLRLLRREAAVPLDAQALHLLRCRFRLGVLDASRRREERQCWLDDLLFVARRSELAPERWAAELMLFVHASCTQTPLCGVRGPFWAVRTPSALRRRLPASWDLRGAVEDEALLLARERHLRHSVRRACRPLGGDLARLVCSYLKLSEANI